MDHSQEINNMALRFGSAWYRGFSDFHRGIYDPPASGTVRQWYIIGQDDARNNRVEFKEDENRIR